MGGRGGRSLPALSSTTKAMAGEAGRRLGFSAGEAWRREGDGHRVAPMAQGLVGAAGGVVGRARRAGMVTCRFLTSMHQDRAVECGAKKTTSDDVRSGGLVGPDHVDGLR